MEPLPPPDAPVVRVADAIREQWYRGRRRRRLGPWDELPRAEKLRWLECAYAAISTWTILRDRSMDP